jgi:hypothetical protein
MEVSLGNPTESKNVSQNQFFTFTSSATCVGGECGDVNVTIDPSQESSDLESGTQNLKWEQGVNSNNITAIVVYGSEEDELMYDTWNLSVNANNWTDELRMVYKGTGTGTDDLDVDIEACPIRNEMIAVFQDGGTNLIYATIWNGTDFSTPIEVGYPYFDNLHAYDVAYEQVSGRAIVVTQNQTIDGDDIVYSIWNGTDWEVLMQEYVTDATTTHIRYMHLASHPYKDEIAFFGGYYDVAWAMIWNGTNWTNELELDSELIRPSVDALTVIYEQISGRALFAWTGTDDDNGRDLDYNIWNGTEYLTEDSVTSICSFDDCMGVLRSAADPMSDNITIISTDQDNDLNTIRWNGSEMTTDTQHDDNLAVNETACAGAAYETTAGHEDYIVLLYTESGIEYPTARFFNGSAWSDYTRLDQYGDLTYHFHFRFATEKTGNIHMISWSKFSSSNF